MLKTTELKCPEDGHELYQLGTVEYGKWYGENLYGCSYCCNRFTTRGGELIKFDVAKEKRSGYSNSDSNSDETMV
jgi:hypothetical protein